MRGCLFCLLQRPRRCQTYAARSSFPNRRQRGSRLLSACDDAHELDAVAFGQSLLRPFAAMQGATVVFNKNRFRSQLVAINELRNCSRLTRIDGFAVE